MKILSIDSSGMVASCALFEDGVILAEYSVNYQKTHSQTLLPMIDEIARMTALDKKSLDAVAIAAGPGSFTGLRIGSATAKGIAMALAIPIIEVPTLMGLAYNIADRQALVCPMMDARRSQVYSALYRMTEGVPQVLIEQMPVAVEALIDRLNAWPDPLEIVFLGDGVPVYQDVLARGMQRPFRFAEAHMNRQRAASVASLAFHLYEAGQYVSADAHKPIYLRKSQAEQEKERRDADS